MMTETRRSLLVFAVTALGAATVASAAHAQVYYERAPRRRRRRRLEDDDDDIELTIRKDTRKNNISDNFLRSALALQGITYEPEKAKKT